MALSIDPVCGMTVDTTTATHTASYQGETYYFCARGCKKTFEKQPENYIQQRGTQQEPGASQCSCSNCHPQQ